VLLGVHSSSFELFFFMPILSVLSNVTIRKDSIRVQKEKEKFAGGIHVLQKR